MRRQTLLAATSLTLVAVAGTVVLTAAATANAQAVPVTYGTDPTGAHPRFAAATTYEVALAGASGAPAALSFEPEPAPAGPLSVTVEPGDTVYGLARRHGASPTDIIEANGLAAPYALSLGQTLLIPHAEAASAPASSGDAIAAAVVAPEPAAPAPKAEHLVRDIERVADARESGDAAPSAAGDGKLDAIYAVRKGDTLYSLSRRFEVPVGALAEANGLAAPYALSLGQSIVVPKVVPAPEAQPVLAAASPATELKTSTGPFAWPIRGAILSGYGSLLDGVRNDGINIAAPAGAPVRAAADGEVVYKGDELAGYGNLLLVKHEDGWVSAYAHTGAILVSKGDQVRRGQVVAKVGDTGSVDGPQLHFELRHDLKPQDPVKALNGQLTQVGYRR